ncbi:KAP family P-loop NTPase fold protein [Vreelandella titanicae]|uniref:KAP family P-loop NTPase fold protein n=1 Tax=Vreelandella titanicae TaxID=664683 RepID=UPI001680D63B|nr:P-loop NTPase fold protein [Halomonas titanicae]QNU60662.1 ATPase [Halomonas titanicae]
MWTDNETEYDFLNFGSVAKTVSQVIEDANEKPVSIGVSGAWGIGKSSMIKLIRNELKKSDDSQLSTENKYVFVEFNAWLYQGYDDARAALIEVVASTLLKEAESRETGLDKAKDLCARVDWFRAIKMSASSAISLGLGLPPVGLVNELIDTGKGLAYGGVNQSDIENIESVAENISAKTKGLITPKKVNTPPKQIEALRQSFEETLKDMGVTLVVLIDDLDRCLPETTISTLEAIRLLLFLKHTAFVIAADDQMIKHAVKRHFQGVEDELVTNYFDKLIQVPIRVPPLGTQEVRAYMMLLHVENSNLSSAQKESLRSGVCQQLSKTWQGKRVDLKFLRELNGELPDELVARLDVADRLAPIMTSATGISGNPRLIKRFMNALSIRMAMAKSQGVTVDEASLAKILLFERCGDTKAYAELIKAVTESNDGTALFISEWEEIVSAGNTPELNAPWDDAFALEWLRLSPPLGSQDLRGALYVSREHAPLITPEDRLSPEAAELLQAYLEHPDMASSSKEQLQKIQKPELSVIMDRLFGKANQQQEWGTPPILDPLILIAQADSTQAQRLGGFLKDRPAAQIKASIVPKLDGETWATGLFDYWLADEDIARPVKNSINSRRKNGNVSIK